MSLERRHCPACGKLIGIREIRPDGIPVFFRHGPVWSHQGEPARCDAEKLWIWTAQPNVVFPKLVGLQPFAQRSLLLRYWWVTLALYIDTRDDPRQFLIDMFSVLREVDDAAGRGA